MFGFLSPGGSLARQHGAIWTRRPAARTRVRRTSVARDGAADRRRVLEQGLFLDAVRRERQRADRFDGSFELITISPAALTAAEAWSRVIEVIGDARRDTDLVGWVRRGRVLGLLVADPMRKGDSLAVLKGLLRRTQGPCAGEAWQIERCAYPDRGHSRTNGLTVLDADRPVVYSLLKRTLDVAGSATLMFVLAPVFLLVAALVKLTSPGPVLFRQMRVGHFAQPFTMLKFRTMRVGADPTLHQQYVTRFIRRSDDLAPADGQPVFKLVDDPRITPIGRFLRRSSLDELPQFWNVLRGDMSLVGPRPPLDYEVNEYARWHRRRLFDAKPGITGLWQVIGRSRTTFDEMVRLDLRYAKRRSIWNDIKILLMTPRAVIAGKGAR